MLGPMTSEAPCEEDRVTLYSGLIYQAKFHMTANVVYRHLIANPDLSVTEAQELGKMIDAWRDSCPPYLKEPSLATEADWVQFSKDRLQICDKNLRILVWRPFLLGLTSRDGNRDSSTDDTNNLQKESALQCLYTAKESMDLILQSINRKQHTRLGASFLL